MIRKCVINICERRKARKSFPSEEKGEKIFAFEIKFKYKYSWTGLVKCNVIKIKKNFMTVIPSR